jgi:acyl carrier protein
MSNLADELKEMIIDVLALEDISIEDIDTNAPHFGDGLGLDSIDALELGLALKKRYNIHLNAESQETKQHFASVQSLVDLVEAQRAALEVVMLSEEIVLTNLREWMEALFEIEPADIQLESNLYSDLDVDSIDAIDLVVKIKELTGKQVKPEDFKKVRTVQDVVVVIQNMSAE